MKKKFLKSIMLLCVAGTLVGCGAKQTEDSALTRDAAELTTNDLEEPDEYVLSDEEGLVDDDPEKPVEEIESEPINAYAVENYFFMTDLSYLRLPIILGDESDAIDEINSEIEKLYDTYSIYNTEDADGFCEVKYKLFENERYVSIIVSDIEYPNYGTDGNLHGWTLDKKLNKVVSAEDALEEAGLTSEQILSELSEKYRVVDESNANFIESDYIDISDICVVYKYDSNPTFYFLADYMVQGAEDWWTYCTYENGMPVDNGPWPGLGAISGYEDEYIIPGLYEYNTATNEDISKEEISLSIYTSDIDYDSYYREIGTAEYNVYDKAGNQMYTNEFLYVYYDAYSGEYVLLNEAKETFARFVLTEDEGIIVHKDGAYDAEFNLVTRYES